MLAYSRHIRSAYARPCFCSEADREEAPTAESAPAGKQKIPLASLYRASKIHGSTPLKVTKSALSEKAEDGWNHEKSYSLFVPKGDEKAFLLPYL